MLYSGKGDDGTTQAFGCDQKRISKSSELPEALGALDELNAFLGFVKMKVRVNRALRMLCAMHRKFFSSFRQKWRVRIKEWGRVRCKKLNGW